MLTARGRPEDVLKGFASGADDYLPKPFELPILLARLQGLLRRREWMQQNLAASAVPGSRRYRVRSLFSFHGRTIDFGKLELRVNGSYDPADSDGSRIPSPPDQKSPDGSSPANQFSKRCGACTKTPTPAPSTTSLSACGAISKRMLPSPGIFSPFAAWAIVLSRSQKKIEDWSERTYSRRPRFEIRFSR